MTRGSSDTRIQPTRSQTRYDFSETVLNISKTVSGSKEISEVSAKNDEDCEEEPVIPYYRLTFSGADPTIRNSVKATKPVQT